MTILQWKSARNFCVGLSGGVLIGLLIAAYVADKPGWKWFVYDLSALVILVAIIPDVALHIIRGVHHYKSAARPRNGLK